MPFVNKTLSELAKLVGGQLIADVDAPITGAAAILDAQAGDITLLDNLLHRQSLEDTKATAVVAPRGFGKSELPAIEVDNVHEAFIKIILAFRPEKEKPPVGISPQAIISDRATIAENVEIHPGAIIAEDVKIGSGCVIHSGVQIMANCSIGQDVTIYPAAVLYENTAIGNRVIVHAGVILGCCGFGYSMVDGRHQPSAQLGNVEVADDVEIGAGTTIDRGTYGPTIIGEGTKIDNQVMIAHNCRIGRHNLICSQVGIAGSTSTGEYVVMAGQVGICDHVHIGDRAMIGAKAGVANDIPHDSSYLGSPASPLRDQKLRFAAFSRLPDMRRQLKVLTRKIESLEKEQADKGNQSDAA